MSNRLRNCRDIAWFRQDSPRQRLACAVPEGHQVLQRIDAFDPVLAGTLPLDVDLPDSDLDIIWEVHDAWDFVNCLMDQFGMGGEWLRSGRFDPGCFDRGCER